MIKNIKSVMNPMRLQVLKRLYDLKETNINALGSGVCISYSREAIQKAFNRFVELEFIKYTGGGYFGISEKGINYLKECNLL